MQAHMFQFFVWTNITPAEYNVSVRVKQVPADQANIPQLTYMSPQLDLGFRISKILIIGKTKKLFASYGQQLAEKGPGHPSDTKNCQPGPSYCKVGLSWQKQSPGTLCRLLSYPHAVHTPFMVGFTISGSSPVASGTLVAKLGPVETSRVESPSTQQSVQPPQRPPLANQLSSQCRVKTRSQSFSHLQESWLPKSDMKMI